jgi:hypothetical protein
MCQRTREVQVGSSCWFMAQAEEHEDLQEDHGRDPLEVETVPGVHPTGEQWGVFRV